MSITPLEFIIAISAAFFFGLIAGLLNGQRMTWDKVIESMQGLQNYIGEK